MSGLAIAALRVHMQMVEYVQQREVGRMALPLIMLKRLLWQAAASAATDKRVHAKADKIYREEVKPRVKAGYAKAKPKIDAAKADIETVARDTDPVRKPVSFARQLAKQMRHHEDRGEDRDD